MLGLNLNYVKLNFNNPKKKKRKAKVMVIYTSTFYKMNEGRDKLSTLLAKWGHRRGRV